MESYRILLADDHVLFREAISKAINATYGLKVVGGVSDGLELLSALQKSAPDLIILDLTMPNLSGLAAAKQVKVMYPSVKILILTMHNTLSSLKGAFSIGVNGYLLKEDAFQDLIAAIKTIRKGNAFISPQISGNVTDIISPQEQKERLTSQEVKILSLISQYMPDEEIVESLSIAKSTFDNHLFKIRRKLNLKTRAQLIKFAREEGLVETF
jgi:two-component system, NarL family, nitrate/nitrite response regulator NarL